MDHTIQSIREDITAGQLEQAASAALEYATYCGLEDIANGLLGLNSQLKTHHDNWNRGLLNYEDYSTKHAQLTHHLISWVSHLPEQPVRAKKGRKLMVESTFKKRVFYLLCIIKAGVLVRLWYHWTTGGFSQEQFQSTATLLAPAFAAYISVMIADYLRQSKDRDPVPRYMAGPLVTFSYWLFPIYAFLLIIFMENKAAGNLSYSGMNFWIALVESVLGGYIGQIVFALFKREQ